jgi:excisionase family DNA binding protein
MEPLLVSKREAARILSVSPRTIHRLLQRSELRGARVGRRKLVLRKSIETLVGEASK